MNLVCFLFGIMATKFFLVNNKDVNGFSEQQESRNTKKKMLYDLKIFKYFLESCNKTREID